MKHTKRISNKAEIMEIRKKMSFADYVDEYNRWYNAHPRIQELLQETSLSTVEQSLVEHRLVSLCEYPDFVEALQTLLYCGDRIQDRELWFTSKFFLENFPRIEKELEHYENLIK
eukprot:UN02860